ncbi:MAG: CDP-diacylglycerol--glycerol-3-phosphate 3-phosphatidyltransferase [Proteobacteria bacterium]|nr:CDP-diacylglycerol--glycerol-3-phosphate 3-phosphatidyltransferase [Pseudomonadota bacterium]MCP4916892.1 CDP-diacylglycerol--glycerol-3-phosphate 3-phosphatidyltransferase [Pseudomonadota bacterium]
MSAPWYRRKGFWNLPNTITVARMVVVPVMVGLLWDEPKEYEAVMACVVFVAAMLSDILDGYLARKWELVSVAGAFLDPLADKLMVATTMVMLVALGWLPAWIAALIICRELTITALRTVALSEGLTLPADSLGKFKTAFQSTALGFLLWHYDTQYVPGRVVDPAEAGMVLMYIATFFTVLSGGNYLRNFFIHAAEKERREGLR